MHLPDQKPRIYDQDAPPEPTFLQSVRDRIRSLTPSTVFLTLACTAIAASGLLETTHSETPQEMAASEAPCSAPLPTDYSAVDKLLATGPNNAAVTARDVRLKRVDSAIRAQLGPFNTAATASSLSYLTAANAILKPYNITITEAPGERPTSNSQHSQHIKNQAAPASQLSSIERADLRSIIKNIYELPLSYVHYSGLRKIILYRARHGLHSEDSAYVHAVNAPESDHTKVYYNIAFEGAPRTMGHEIYHLVNAKECADGTRMYNDPGFTALNGSNIYNGGHPSSHNLFSLKVVDALAAIAIIEDKAVEHQDQAAFERARHKALSILNKITSVSDYSFTSVIEDEAELGADFASPPDLTADLDPATPRLRAKVLFLLARLYHYDPRAAQQLIATMPKVSSANNYVYYGREIAENYRTKASFYTK